MASIYDFTAQAIDGHAISLPGSKNCTSAMRPRG
jgi:hypothetical protein